MSDRERPLHHEISLRTIHFASELARWQHHQDEALGRIQGREWQSSDESPAAYRERIVDYLRQERVWYLYRHRSVAREFGSDAAVLYFDERIRRLEPREGEPQNDGH